MAIPFLNSINLSGNQLQNAVIQPLADKPGTFKIPGRIFFCNDADSLHFKGFVKDLTGVSSPSDAQWAESLKTIAFIDDITLANLGGATTLRKIETLGNEANSTGVLYKSAKDTWSFKNPWVKVGSTQIGLGSQATTISGLVALKFTPQTSAATNNATAQDSGIAIEVVTINGKQYLHTPLPFFSSESVSAFGTGSESSGSGLEIDLMKSWTDSYTDDTALGAGLGVELHNEILNLKGGAAVSVTTTGSGNVVTSVTKTGTVITATKGLTVATLDTGGKIPTSQLPDYLLGQVLYGGTVGANALATLSTNAKAKLGVTGNTQTLTDNTTAKTGYKDNEGIYYIATADLTFAGLDIKVGDWLISTGSSWQKVDNTDAVTSVNGKIGAVSLSLADIAGSDSLVSKFGTKTGEITLRTGSTTVGAVNFTMNGNELQGTTVLPSGISSVTTTNVANWNSAFGAFSNRFTITNSDLDTNHIYTTPSTSYFKNKNLVVSLYDSSGNVVYTDIQLVGADNSVQVKAIFGGALSSTYYLVVIGIKK